jgi:hypothetical protein
MKLQRSNEFYSTDLWLFRLFYKVSLEIRIASAKSG